MAELFCDLKQWKIIETDYFDNYSINPILAMLYITYVEASHGEKEKFNSDLHNAKDWHARFLTRFKGSDLLNNVPKELWTEIHRIVQEAVNKIIPKKKKCKKAKGFSEGTCR